MGCAKARLIFFATLAHFVKKCIFISEVNMSKNDCTMNHSNHELVHIKERALEGYEIVLDNPGISRILSNISKRKFVVLSKSRCKAVCEKKETGCGTMCLIVIHKNKKHMIFPIIVMYCPGRHRIFTILRKNCYEFREYQKRKILERKRLSKQS